MNPIDLPVGVTVDLSQHRTPRRTGPVGPARAVTVSRSKTPYSILSPTQSLVVETVTRFGQVSSSQIRLLHYTGTDRGMRARSSKHLKALSERGFIRRIPHRLQGFGMGSGEYIYCPPESNYRTPNLHTLEVTELYCQLKQTVPTQYDPEPWAPTIWGGHKITPDAYAVVNGDHYFCEIDLNSEHPAVIAGKMKRYVAAYKGNAVEPGEPSVIFPLVVWLAHDADRVRQLQREADKTEFPRLFECLLFSEAVDFMTNETDLEGDYEAGVPTDNR